MPIYEYRCETCGTTTEALRRVAQADEPIACGQCGGQQTQRCHSVFAAGSSGASGGAMSSLPMQGGCCPCGDPNGPCNR